MSWMRRGLALAITTGTFVASAPQSQAVPYASALRNTAGATWEFVLNEAADNVTIKRNGGNALNLGALTAGRHTFSMTGFSTFDIEVAKNTPKAWTEISQSANLFTRFEQPAGLTINKNAASPYFGTIYVANSRTGATAAAAGGTIPARNMGEGIYALTSDLLGVDVSNPSYSVVTDPQDTSQAKMPGWTELIDTSAGNTTGARSPWRMGLDGAGNLIVTDYSMLGGGIKWASPDLNNGGLLLDQVNAGQATGVMNGSGQVIHSNITSKPMITGTMGVDLKVTAADNGMLQTAGDLSTRSNIWTWDLGNFNPATSGGFTGAPELVIRGKSLGGDNKWFTSVANVTNDVHYSPEHDLYYMTQPRSDGLQASLIIVKADGVDGLAPTVLFDSRQYSIDNNLDGAVDKVGTTLTGIQDIFRNAGTIEISPDGTKMYVRRVTVNGTVAGTGINENPVLGMNSNNPEAVLAIPLDANGLPVLSIDNRGTPETTDDRLAKLEGFQIGAPTAGPRNYELEFDAAGNAYATSSSAETLQVFSPGGNTKAITSSSGSFVVQQLAAGLAGDFNGDLVVNGNDFLVWQRGGSPVPNSASDLALWKAHFGETAAPPIAAVPEPSTLVGGLTAAIFGLAAARRRKSA